MSRVTETQNMEAGPFTCARCGLPVTVPESGTEHRNHCPACLWSVHVDVRPGDRRSSCRGLMEPIGVWIRGDGEWSLIHRCTRCGTLRANRIAGDDDELRLFGLAARPLTDMPFPSRNVFDRIAKGSTT